MRFQTLQEKKIQEIKSDSSAQCSNVVEGGFRHFRLEQYLLLTKYIPCVRQVKGSCILGVQKRVQLPSREQTPISKQRKVRWETPLGSTWF